MTLTAPQPGPVVIGLDTSLTATGIASSNGWCQTVGYQKPRAKDPGITQLPHPQRMEALRTVRAGIIQHIGRPDLVVLETPAFSRAGGGGHERGWLWWSLYDHLTTAEIPVGLMDPRQRMLYATGKGAATKSAVVDAVARRWPQYETGGDDNLADAVVLMAAGRDWLGHPLTTLPKPHRKAIDNALWPEALTTAA